MSRGSISKLRAGVLALVWLTCSALHVLDSAFSVMLWPLAMILFGGLVIVATTGLRLVWEQGDEIGKPVAARVLASAILASAAVAAVGATVPSLGHSGSPPATLALSPIVAPALLAGVAVFALRVLRRGSPRRLAALALAGIAAWPFLTVICLLPGLARLEHLVVEPWAMHLLSLGTIAISGLALVCGALAWRASTAVSAPPSARTIRAR